MNLHAMNDSRDYAFLLSRVFLHKPDDAIPNERDNRIFLQPSVSRPDGQDPPFVSIASFKMEDSSISSYTVGWTGCVSPCNNTSLGG